MVVVEARRQRLERMVTPKLGSTFHVVVYPYLHLLGTASVRTACGLRLESL